MWKNKEKEKGKEEGAIPEAEESGRITSTAIITTAEEKVAGRYPQDPQEINRNLTTLLTPSLKTAKSDLHTAKKARQAHEEQVQEVARQTRLARGTRIAHESALRELDRLSHPERYRQRHRIEAYTQRLAGLRGEEADYEAWGREHGVSVEEERGREERARGECAVLEEKLEELRARGLIDWVGEGLTCS
ncbi:Adenylyltransferase and sulfurtransferase [Venturia inaequalis]|nr:Adenylyltransferase and sulfurtransferase [Venturia inaequalis]